MDDLMISAKELLEFCEKELNFKAFIRLKTWLMEKEKERGKDEHRG